MNPMDIAPAVIDSYFTPLHYVLYLGTIFVLMVVYYEWKWANTCKNNIQVLVAQQGGGGAFVLAPKDGGIVAINNPQTNSVRSWPINELATIDILYPGVGFIPAFMQKTIRLAIVNEGDWEPMLNRSPHREHIASPDIVKLLTDMAAADTTDEATKKQLAILIPKLATGPTREMIANPATLGDLMRNSVLKALATVSSDLMELLKSVNSRLGKVMGPNPTVVYIGLGLIVILLVFLIYKTSAGNLVDVNHKLDVIQQALGIAGAKIPPVAP